MNKEKFVNIINFIKKQSELQDNFISPLEGLSPQTYCDCFLYSEYESIVVQWFTT